MAKSITAMQSTGYLFNNPLKVERYLRRCHTPEDRDDVFCLLIKKYPDEGVKLVSNYNLPDEEKKLLLVEWLIFQPQITCGIFADQRYGKDALICQIFTEVIEYCEKFNIKKPRFVTLGNIKKPPFVDNNDMYFSFRDIPAGDEETEVWIYCSEIETVIPSREGSASENRLFSQLEGTMAQNHQKLFGCCKLASKVDINFIRGMNVRLLKFISPEKLNVENVERENIISSLARWHIPKDRFDKSLALMVFDNQILNASYPLPVWWSQGYSEQFRDIPLDKIKDCVEVYFSNGMNVNSIRTAISQKFRKNLTIDEIKAMLSLKG